MCAGVSWQYRQSEVLSPSTGTKLWYNFWWLYNIWRLGVLGRRQCGKLFEEVCWHTPFWHARWSTKVQSFGLHLYIAHFVEMSQTGNASIHFSRAIIWATPFLQRKTGKQTTLKHRKLSISTVTILCVTSRYALYNPELKLGIRNTIYFSHQVLICVCWIGFECCSENSVSFHYCPVSNTIKTTILLLIEYLGSFYEEDALLHLSLQKVVNINKQVELYYTSKYIKYKSGLQFNYLSHNTSNKYILPQSCNRVLCGMFATSTFYFYTQIAERYDIVQRNYHNDYLLFLNNYIETSTW